MTSSRYLGGMLILGPSPPFFIDRIFCKGLTVARTKRTAVETKQI